MSSNKIILFDIDRTMFDTDKFYAWFKQGLLSVLGEKKGKELKKAMLTYQNSRKRNKGFDPEDFLKHVIKETGFKKNEALINVFYGKDPIYEKCLYPETVSVLQVMSKDYELGVYSEGIKRFQNHKFKSLHTSKYFNKDYIFIFQEKDSPTSINKLPIKSIIIDDKRVVVDHLNKKGFKVVWINRKSKEKHPTVPTIYNLKELLTMEL